MRGDLDILQDWCVCVCVVTGNDEGWPGHTTRLVCVCVCVCVVTGNDEGWPGHSTRLVSRGGMYVFSLCYMMSHRVGGMCLCVMWEICLCMSVCLYMCVSLYVCMSVCMTSAGIQCSGDTNTSGQVSQLSDKPSRAWHQPCWRMSFVLLYFVFTAGLH